MNIYDTHFHLDLQKDKPKAIDCIQKNKIYTIAMTNLPDLYIKEIAHYKCDYIRVALGFHPELIHDYRHQIPMMWEQLQNARYIGEVGLDFSSNMHVNEQIQFFTSLMEKCRYTNKIISIHSRKAVKPVLDIIGESFMFKPILHWFTGSINDAKIASQRGFYFSVNPNMVKTKKFNQLVKVLPRERVLIETDSPFTNGNGSHCDMLKFVDGELRNYGIEPWTNFQQLLRD